MIEPTYVDFLLFPAKTCGTCGTCGTTLPANKDFFQPNVRAGKDGLTSNCRACRAKSSRASYERRRDQRRAQMREYNATRRVRS